MRACIQRDIDELVALADDPNRRLIPSTTEITDIRAARLGHAETVETEEADERERMAAFGLGRGSQRITPRIIVRHRG